MAFFRLSSVAKCCHKHLTLPRIVFIFLALLSFLCGNAFGYARSHSLASPAAKATYSTNQAALITDHCLLTTSFDFGWDAKNQLVRARTKNHSSAAHAYDLTFTHDAEGRRVQKHVVEYQHGAVVSEKFITFVWDGWDLLYERQQLPSGLTTIERKYLWGPDIADGASGGAGGLLLIQETKGNNTQKIIPLYDGTGHVTALTNLNKDLLASYAYGPFGEKISATGQLANSNPWRWATKYFDEETGLYYFGKRYLDPVTGQWLSRELLGESESLNLYSYCHNDPVNRVDVLGLAERDISENWASKKFRELCFALFPVMGGMMSDGDPRMQARHTQAAAIQRDVSIPLLRAPGQIIQVAGVALGDASTDWGARKSSEGHSLLGYTGGVSVHIAGQFVSSIGGMIDPIGMIEQNHDYFVVQTDAVTREAGGGWNGFQAGTRHVFTKWNLEKLSGFAEGDIEKGMEGAGATAGIVLIFLAPEMQAGRMHAPRTYTPASQSLRWWQKGAYIGVPAEMYSGMPRFLFNWGRYLRDQIGEPPPGMIDPHAHHILFKQGNGLLQQQLVVEGQAILRRAGIDPIYGPENLTWAPMRITQQHSLNSIQPLVDALRQLEAVGAPREAFTAILKQYGAVSAGRR